MSRMWRSALLAAILTFPPATLGADGDTLSSFQVTSGKLPGSFFGGIEFASLQTSLQSLSGYGLHFGYQYVLTNHWAVDGSLAQIYGAGAGAGVSALYSAINATVRYAVASEFPQASSQIYFRGRRVVDESPENYRTMAVGLQMNQLFLNGSNAVFNATGLAVVLSYDAQLWGYRMRPELRYGMLSANDADMTAIFANLLFPF